MLDLVSVRRFLREYHFNPQFLGDVLLIYDLYVDQSGGGWNVPVVLQKDGTMFVMFGIEGLDYETSGSRRIAEMVGRMKSFFEEISPHVVVQTYFVHRHDGESDNRMAAGENRVAPFAQAFLSRSNAAILPRFGSRPPFEAKPTTFPVCMSQSFNCKNQSRSKS